jgi:hypothetical protein
MLYKPDGGVHAPEYTELAKKITDGDGIAWGGDPRLGLSIGVVTHRKSGKTMRRLEVYRYCEDGTTQLIGHWHPSQAGQIPADLARMRLGRPGAVSIIDQIDAHNDALEEAAAAARRDVLTERLARDTYRLVHDKQGHAKTSFTVPGRRKP